MSTSVWDDPELKMNDDFVKLENAGDEISGTIVSIRPHRFDDGSVAVQIIFKDAQDGMERTWSAGQVQAKKRLAELRPEVGWRFRARLVSIEKRAGGKTLKHIDVEAVPPAAGMSMGTQVSATADIMRTSANAVPATQFAQGGRVGLACPQGIDPQRWAQMDGAQQQQMYEALGLGHPAARSASNFSDEPPF